MPSTRSASRLTGASQPSDDNATKSSPLQTANSNGAGQKRKADSSPAQPKKTGGKRGRPKKQKTIEETITGVGGEEEGEEKEGDSEMKETEDKEEESEIKDGGLNDADMKNAAEEVEAGQQEVDSKKSEESKDNVPASSTNGVKDPAKDEEPTAEAAEEGEGDISTANGTKHEDQPQPANEKEPTQDENDVPKPSTDDNTKQQAKEENTSKANTTNKADETKDATADSANAVEESKERDANVSSNVLEKGLIYFFLRGRVGVDSVDSVQDVARSYLVLRPLPRGAALTSGTVPDGPTNRLLALPKKVLPKSHRDQFMTFVEKSKTTIADLKESFMQGSTYDTKTTGVRHSPAVTPVGEGVYAITTTGAESHLAYMLTIPSDIGEVQRSLGLDSKGAFALSLKNPAHKGPANATLDHPAEFSQEVQDEFRGRRWMPARPEHLDYVHAQVLLIGEAQGDLGKAGEGDENKEEGKEAPAEEIETLEEEDTARVEGLKGEEAEAVFADLGISMKEFPELLTTW